MPSGSSLTRRSTFRTVSIGFCVVAVTALTSCSEPTSVSPPVPSTSAVEEMCDTLQPKLPKVVVGQSQVKTDPESKLTAAWGHPSITFQCGVDEASGVAPDSELITVNGVDWFPQQHQSGYLFTTVGLAVNIAMSVPDQYKPETSALADVSTVIAQVVVTKPKG